MNGMTFTRTHENSEVNIVDFSDLKSLIKANNIKILSVNQIIGTSAYIPSITDKHSKYNDVEYLVEFLVN